MMLVASGIAEEPEDLKAHLHTLFERLGAHPRAAAMAEARIRGLLET
jgi:DNA-binding NarL/FixJ family response regulator